MYFESGHHGHKHTIDASVLLIHLHPNLSSVTLNIITFDGFFTSAQTFSNDLLASQRCQIFGSKTIIHSIGSHTK